MRCATPHQVACKSVTWQHIRPRGTSVVERATHPPQHPESSSSPLNEGYLNAQRRNWLSTMRRRRGCHARRLCVGVKWLPCCSIRSVCPDVQSDLWLQHCAILVLDDALCSLQATACHSETLKAFGWLSFLHSHRLSTSVQASPPASRHEEAMHTFCT